MLLGPTMLPNPTLLRQCRTLPYPEVRIRRGLNRCDGSRKLVTCAFIVISLVESPSSMPNSNLGDWDGTGTGLGRDWDETGVRCDWVGMGTNAGICTGLALEQGDV